MLFFQKDVEVLLDLERQHSFLAPTHFDDPFFRFNEGSSLMEAVAADGNLQAQPFVPFGDELCKMSLHLQPGPIPGFNASRLDLGSVVAPPAEQQPMAVQQGKKRTSGPTKSGEGSPIPAIKRARPSSVVSASSSASSFRPSF